MLSSFKSAKTPASLLLRNTVYTSYASFSSAATVDKSALFTELIQEAGQIKDYNFKSYFVRRATEDQA